MSIVKDETTNKLFESVLRESKGIEFIKKGPKSLQNDIHELVIEDGILEDYPDGTTVGLYPSSKGNVTIKKVGEGKYEAWRMNHKGGYSEPWFETGRCEFLYDND